jgi:hypothetical protein
MPIEISPSAPGYCPTLRDVHRRKTPFNLWTFEQKVVPLSPSERLD